MTAPAVLPHRDAIWTLLQAIPHMAWYEGKVPATPPLNDTKRVRIYGVFWPGVGQVSTDSLNNQNVNLQWPFTVAVYAGDVDAWLLGCDWVNQALVDVVPTVTGRSCGPVALDYAPKHPTRVDDPMPERFGGPLLFSFLSVPA